MQSGLADVAQHPRCGQHDLLTQEPTCHRYCPPGTLRDQVMYPSTADPARLNPEVLARLDDLLMDLLEVVDLGKLASRWSEGLDSIRDWGSTLSLGEQQRLAFARLL